MGNSDHQNIEEDRGTKEETYNCKRTTWISQVGIEAKNKKGIDGRAPSGVEPAA